LGAWGEVVHRLRCLPGDAGGPDGKILWPRAPPAATRHSVEADCKPDTSHLFPP